MACRLAKSSDNIYLVHIPCIQYWPKDLRNSTYDPDSDRNSPFRPLFTMTYQQYENYVKETKQRRDQIIGRYKAMGYNVSCVEIPNYFEIGERILRNYSLTSRYSQVIQQTFADNPEVQPMIRYVVSYSVLVVLL